MSQTSWPCDQSSWDNTWPERAHLHSERHLTHLQGLGRGSVPALGGLGEAATALGPGFLLQSLLPGEDHVWGFTEDAPRKLKEGMSMLQGGRPGSRRPRGWEGGRRGRNVERKELAGAQDGT